MVVFEQNNAIKKIGYGLGYIFSYLLFTALLFLMLSLLGKIPQSWSYIHILTITFAIALIGIAVRRLLR